MYWERSWRKVKSSRKYSLILFRPYTGRTHQLRVAAKAMGIALLGDPIYKDGQDDIVATRTYLHASGISIPSIDGEAEINIWNPPLQFESLAGKSELDSALRTLMQNHCDIPQLLDAMHERTRLKIENVHILKIPSNK